MTIAQQIIDLVKKETRDIVTLKADTANKIIDTVIAGGAAKVILYRWDNTAQDWIYARRFTTTDDVIEQVIKKNETTKQMKGYRYDCYYTDGRYTELFYSLNPDLF